LLKASGHKVIKTVLTALEERIGCIESGRRICVSALLSVMMVLDGLRCPREGGVPGDTTG
jgi:hypothetical protein